jgi:hypothetical protein
VTLWTDDKRDNPLHHQRGIGEEMVALERLAEALVIAGQLDPPPVL